MKYYVRTTGERDLSQYSFLDYTPLYDFKHESVKSFIEQMRLISNDDALFMEDDIIFCDNFINKVNEVIAQYPNQIINFFFQPLAYLQTSEVKGKKFLYNQCVYYPKGISKIIADKMQELIDNGIEWKQYDEIEGAALDALGINFIQYRPMLVQHIGVNSIIGNNWLNDAKTIYFIDDIKGMDYNDAGLMLKYGYKQYDKIGISHPIII